MSSVAKLMGHASQTTTEKHYIHLTNKHLHDEANKSPCI